MRNYLSFGAGVNSTALMILLREKGIEFEAVFADTGGEWPETYEHIDWLQAHGWPVTILTPEIQGVVGLHAYCVKYRIIPVRWQRWCTSKFKVRPLQAYAEKGGTMYLGIDYGEAHRRKPSGQMGLKYEFPLVDWGIDRQGCIEIIEAMDMPVPPKSGCYFCPFQRASQFRLLRDEYPELYCKARELEELAIARRAKEGKWPIYLMDKPLDVVVQEGQLDLFGLRKPCMCGL